MFDLNDHRITLWHQLVVIIEVGQESTEATLTELYQIERFWAFPDFPVLDRIVTYLNKQQYQLALNLVRNVIVQIAKPKTKAFIPFASYVEQLDKIRNDAGQPSKKQAEKACFDLLVFHPDPANYFYAYYHALIGLQSDRDEFLYDILFVSNLADAVTALQNNQHIQACVSLSGCVQASDLEIANQHLSIAQNLIGLAQTKEAEATDSALLLNQLAKVLRPEVDHYYISESIFADLPANYFESFSRVFYYEHPFKDLHYSMLSNVRDRFNTPFYNALQAYSKKTKSVFHALPISQGSSVKHSPWVNDFYEFYGHNIFDAETSGTQGGLDSLLNPKGAIKNAQDKAAKSFGSDKTFFVTNGTSTSNKIVMQANLSPDDIVFVSSDCHKSIPYGVVLSGANVFFMQTNAVNKYDLYGAIPLQQIKDKMHLLKQQGLLHKLKQIVLTNSTFDGLIYDVETYMMEILAIKPDVIFHWDEAWYAHAHFNPLYYRRHAMSVAKILKNKFTSKAYKKQYQNTKDKSTLPNPDKVKLRIYATQSTHKTLSSFRQGSMIHVYDECFNQDTFLDAFYTHTSTSPNYQILASLDVARRQMALEGYHLVQKSIHLANWVSEKITNDSKISQIFTILNEHDIYPEQAKKPFDKALAQDKSLALLTKYHQKGMMVDPTRITLDVRKTGLTGGHFRKLLIDKYDIQVNKTSRHTVLFIVNIGATQQTVLYLYNVLAEIADRLLTTGQKAISVNKQLSMPQQRLYHKRYLPFANKPEMAEFANIRQAYYDAYNADNLDFIHLTTETMAQAKAGKTWVAAVFITPYPPGFPLLVPGQIIDYDILYYFSKIINDEIHGFHKEQGLKVFKPTLLKA